MSLLQIDVLQGVSLGYLESPGYLEFLEFLEFLAFLVSQEEMV